MLRTRGRWRAVGLGIGLAFLALLLTAGEARAAKYAVAQCGWRVGADADWADSTGGAKFRSDAYCVGPAGSDPFDGMHMKSLVRDGQASTVSGTRFARWRWVAPGDTGIVKVQGTWWHALHDGMQHRLGTTDGGGALRVFASDSVTDTSLRTFVAGFGDRRRTFQSRLLCARAESSHCSLSPQSWSAVRAVTITLEDPGSPGASIGGELLGGGWRRGYQGVSVGAGDGGSGARYSETYVDGKRAAVTEFGCEKTLIGGAWHGTRMRPCETSVAATQRIDTRALSDGPHSVHNCSRDFASNVGCTAVHTVRVDNNAPGSPRELAVADGESWRRVNDFDISWRNPDQGKASPIGGTSWRLTGPSDYDSRARFAAGRDRRALENLQVPAPGAYRLEAWLRDEAGNESRAGAVVATLRFDDVPPGVTFEAVGDPGVSGVVKARVADAHSGPAAGRIFLRRLGASAWTELQAGLEEGAATEAPGGGAAKLAAELPLDRLAPGIYELRAEAVDGAGNGATTTRRSDGTEMLLRVAPSAKAVGPKVDPEAKPRRRRARTHLFARLKRGRRIARRLTVSFGKRARLVGRLIRASGAGVGNRRLTVVSRPAKGAFARVRRISVTTGPRGGFRVLLPPGPSRRIAVRFRGDAGLAPSRRAGLWLRVRGGVLLRTAKRHLRTGQLLRIGGRVRARGTALPRRGKLVAIQYFESEARSWRPVLVVRTDHAGRFRTGYRFRYVTGTARVRLRAMALPEQGWPYVPGASRPRTVRVSG